MLAPQTLEQPVRRSDPVTAVLASPDFFAGGGEMGRRIREFDWARHSLGPQALWPQSLKTLVRVMLDSRYAMWMLWGPELTFFCNDAYLPTVGIKREWVLGARSDKVWEEIWSDIGPRIRQVLEQGQSTWDEGLLLFLERSGFSEETYHTFSYSPVYDDGGRIAGMLCVVTEVTESVSGRAPAAHPARTRRARELSRACFHGARGVPRCRRDPGAESQRPAVRGGARGGARAAIGAAGRRRRCRARKPRARGRAGSDARAAVAGRSPRSCAPASRWWLRILRVCRSLPAAGRNPWSSALLMPDHGARVRRGRRDSRAGPEPAPGLRRTLPGVPRTGRRLSWPGPYQCPGLR